MQSWYDASTRAHNILSLTKSLVHTHLYRLKPLVDNSPRKFECGFAKSTVRFIQQDKDTLINLLENLRTEIDEILQQLRGGNV